MQAAREAPRGWRAAPAGGYRGVLQPPGGNRGCAHPDRAYKPATGAKGNPEAQVSAGD